MKNVYLIFILFIFVPSSIFAEIVLKLIVKSEDLQKNMQFALVVALETKKKTFTKVDGTAILKLPKGKHTILVRLNGYQNDESIVNLTEDVEKIILLKISRVRSKTIEIRGRLNTQTAGRQSLSQKELKGVPGTLSDALGAITTLPSVSRSDGSFGSLILRGSIDDGNQYTIDGIPLLYPQHYGGIALAVPINFIKKIDVYASAPPIDFGQVYGGVIAITSQDKVDKMKGIIEVSPLQTSLYFQIPLSINNINFGYSISSVRVAYLDYTLRPFIRTLFPNLSKVRINFPFYLDYQQKLVFHLTTNKKHSINFTSLGSVDRYRKETSLITDSEKGLSLQSVTDSFTNATQIDRDSEIYINRGEYIYKPFKEMTNRFSISHSYNYVDSYKYIPGISISSDLIGGNGLEIEEDELVNTLVTNVVSLKNLWNWDYINNDDVGGTLTFGLAYDYTHYDSFGETEFLAVPSFSDQSLVNYIIDSIQTGAITGVEDVFRVEDSTFQMDHHSLDAYLKSKLYFSALLLQGGVKASYLHFTETVAPSAWFNIEYTVPIIQTTFFGAAGYYSSFVQINSYKINKAISQQILFSIVESEPENAIHVTAGFIQPFLKSYSLKMEGFYTRVEDVGYLEYDLVNNRYIIPVTSLRHYGVEIVASKDLSQMRHDFSFWVSYAFTKSLYKNASTNDEFIRFPFEQEHALKINATYRIFNHEIGVKFEIYSGFPYTPFTEADRIPFVDVDIYTPSSLDVALNSANYPFRHQLDLRYTYTHYHKSFFWKLYFEVINVYNYRATRRQEFNYFQPFTDRIPNPRLVELAADFPLYFNISFEVHI